MINQDSHTSRREFLKTSGTAALAGTIASQITFPSNGSAAPNSDKLKIGLIGCGGRGSGAAQQALNADSNIVLHSMGDAFPDHLESSLANLSKQFQKEPDKINVAPERRFTGLDAYQKVINSGVDVVLLATPPGFRSIHIKAAVEANKHVFCEKPIATDAFGYRSFLETAKESKRKNLALVAGFCWRSHLAQRAAYKKVLDGEIGDVRTIYGTYNTGPARDVKVDPSWGPLETQLRNWMHFTWLSGDHLVEQAVHNVDMMNWAMNNEMPLKCIAHGGRQIRPEPMFGHIFDHFSVVYEWKNGVKGFLFCRQQAGCASDNTETIWGSKGTARIMLFKGRPFITNLAGETIWKYEGPTPDMYQVEHDEMFASIRAGTPRNDGDWLANSTMMAIMGRMAGYTGKEISWEEAINSKQRLVPEEFDWKTAPPVPPLAMPGATQFI